VHFICIKSAPKIAGGVMHLSSDSTSTRGGERQCREGREGRGGMEQKGGVRFIDWVWMDALWHRGPSCRVVKEVQ